MSKGLGKRISDRLRRVTRMFCLRLRACKMTRCAYALLGTQLVSTWPVTRLARVSFTLI